jgi:cyclase
VNRTLIVAKIQPGAESEVASIFGRSDATSMPYEIGVRERSLFAFHDLYFHLVDFNRDTEDAVRTAMTLPAFRAISEELDPYIAAYDPTTWRSPRDAQARCFYHWSQTSVSAS